MQTFEEYVQDLLEKARSQQHLGNLLLVAGFILSMAHEAFSFFMGVGFFMNLTAVYKIRKKVKCPSCNKKLGYLLTNTQYCKRFIAFGLPEAFPDSINACPHCDYKFDSLLDSVSQKLKNQPVK